MKEKRQTQEASEAAYVARLVARLQRDGWQTWEEVPWHSHRADIVARRGPIVAVVECKRTMGLALLQQCLHWHAVANQVYAASPQITASTRSVLERVLPVLRIGAISNTSILLPAPIIRRAPFRPQFVERLCQERASGSALSVGGSQSTYWTPFRATRSALASVVAAHPGITLRDAVSAITHHYQSDRAATSALAQWIRAGILPEIQAVRVGRSITLLPRSPEPERNDGITTT